MPEATLQRCLALCARARALCGEAPDAVLVELEAELQTLAHAQAVAANPLPSNDFDWQHEPVITMDLAGYLTGWNRGAQILFGYTPEEAIGQHILFLYADEPSVRQGEIHELFLDRDTRLIEVRRRKKSGEIFRANLSLSHMLDDNNEPIGMVAHLSEVVDRLSPEEKQRLHARIIEDSEEGILITGPDERIASVNSAFSRITGYSAREAIGQTPDFLNSGVHGVDFRAQVRAALNGAGAWQGEIVGRRKNGELFPQSVSIGVVRNSDGVVTHAFSIFSDISVLRAAEERMQQIVNYDGLTGLPNRTLFYQLVEQALATSRRVNDHSALLVIDLNRFTSINDTLGHPVGDELLRQVGQRFRVTLRDEDILARFGGDEFVVGLVNIRKREHAGRVAEKLLAALAAPFIIDSHALHIGASIGIATHPEDGTNATDLQRTADIAMKRMQERNESGYLFFSPEMNARAKEQWHLEMQLRQALAQHELVLYYQPKVSLHNGRIVGAEALVRWQHPEQGLLGPERFVTLAEETGLIAEVSSWVIDQACRQISAWSEAGIEPMPIAINISARQFDEGLPERLQAALDAHGVACDLLKLEITESLLVRGQDKVIPIMNRLVALGFSLSLDDFGTGYSSLAYLKKFPITTLKIDRAFVVGVPEDENDCAIAQAIVTMGKQLRQEIVAEGVETPAQMAFLRDLGCDQLQGYLFSPPIPPAAFAELITSDRRLPLDDTPR